MPKPFHELLQSLQNLHALASENGGAPSSQAFAQLQDLFKDEYIFPTADEGKALIQLYDDFKRVTVAPAIVALEECQDQANFSQRLNLGSYPEENEYQQWTADDLLAYLQFLKNFKNEGGKCDSCPIDQAIDAVILLLTLAVNRVPGSSVAEETTQLKSFSDEALLRATRYLPTQRDPEIQISTLMRFVIKSISEILPKEVLQKRGNRIFSSQLQEAAQYCREFKKHIQGTFRLPPERHWKEALLQLPDAEVVKLKEVEMMTSIDFLHDIANGPHEDKTRAGYSATISTTYSNKTKSPLAVKTHLSDADYQWMTKSGERSVGATADGAGHPSDIATLKQIATKAYQTAEALTRAATGYSDPDDLYRALPQIFSDAATHLDKTPEHAGAVLTASFKSGAASAMTVVAASQGDCRAFAYSSGEKRVISLTNPQQVKRIDGRYNPLSVIPQELDGTSLQCVIQEAVPGDSIIVRLTDGADLFPMPAQVSEDKSSLVIPLDEAALANLLNDFSENYPHATAADYATFLRNYITKNFEEQRAKLALEETYQSFGDDYTISVDKPSDRDGALSMAPASARHIAEAAEAGGNPEIHSTLIQLVQNINDALFPLASLTPSYSEPRFKRRALLAAQLRADDLLTLIEAVLAFGQYINTQFPINQGVEEQARQLRPYLRAFEGLTIPNRLLMTILSSARNHMANPPAPEGVDPNTFIFNLAEQSQFFRDQLDAVLAGVMGYLFLMHAPEVTAQDTLYLDTAFYYTTLCAVEVLERRAKPPTLKLECKKTYQEECDIEFADGAPPVQMRIMFNAWPAMIDHYIAFAQNKKHGHSLFLLAAFLHKPQQSGLFQNLDSARVLYQLAIVYLENEALRQEALRALSILVQERLEAIDVEYEPDARIQAMKLFIETTVSADYISDAIVSYRIALGYEMIARSYEKYVVELKANCARLRRMDKYSPEQIEEVRANALHDRDECRRETNKLFAKVLTQARGEPEFQWIVESAEKYLAEAHEKGAQASGSRSAPRPK